MEKLRGAGYVEVENLGLPDKEVLYIRQKLEIRFGRWVDNGKMLIELAKITGGG